MGWWACCWMASAFLTVRLDSCPFGAHLTLLRPPCAWEDASRLHPPVIKIKVKLQSILLLSALPSPDLHRHAITATRLPLFAPSHVGTGIIVLLVSALLMPLPLELHIPTQIAYIIWSHNPSICRSPVSGPAFLTHRAPFLQICGPGSEGTGVL